MNRSDAALGNVDRWHFVDTSVRGAGDESAPRIPQGSNLYVRGWALLPGPRLAAGVAIVAGSLRFEADYGLPRPDVAQALGDPALAACGFSAIGKLRDLPAGALAIAVSAYDDAGMFYELARRDIDLAPSSELLAGKRLAAPDAMRVCIDDVATSSDPVAVAGTLLRANAGDTIYIRGWAVDLKAGAALAGAVAIFDGAEYIAGVHGLPRDDVAGALALPHARKCGFTFHVPTRMLEPGEHTLDLACIAADGGSYHTQRVATLELA